MTRGIPTASGSRGRGVVEVWLVRGQPTLPTTQAQACPATSHPDRLHLALLVKAAPGWALGYGVHGRTLRAQVAQMPSGRRPAPIWLSQQQQYDDLRPTRYKVVHTSSSTGDLRPTRYRVVHSSSSTVTYALPGIGWYPAAAVR